MQIISNRLQLSPIDEKSRTTLKKLLTNKEIMQFDFNGPLDEGEAGELIKNWEKYYKVNGYGRFSVNLKSGFCIGYCGVSKGDIGGVSEYELDFRFLPAYWGKGYATEAAEAYCQWVREQFHVANVVAAIKPYNSKIIHVVQQLGMVFDREVKISGCKNHLYRINYTL